MSSRRQLPLFKRSSLPTPDGGLRDIRAPVRQCGTAFRRRGIAIGPVLGCGAYGCAYAATYRDMRGYVVKVTSDPNEIRTNLFLFRHRPLPRALPQTLGVWSMKRCGDAADLAAILREDLDDVPWHGTPVPARVLEVVHALYRAVGHRIGDEAAWKYDLTERLLKLREQDNDEGVALIQRHLAAADELQRWLTKHNVYLGDMHQANVGWRKSAQLMVVRDLGMSTSPPGRRAPFMGLGNGPVHLIARREPWKR